MNSRKRHSNGTNNLKSTVSSINSWKIQLNALNSYLLIELLRASNQGILNVTHSKPLSTRFDLYTAWQWVPEIQQKHRHLLLLFFLNELTVSCIHSTTDFNILNWPLIWDKNVPNLSSIMVLHPLNIVAPSGWPYIVHSWSFSIKDAFGTGAKCKFILINPF